MNDAAPASDFSRVRFAMTHSTTGVWAAAAFAITLLAAGWPAPAHAFVEVARGELILNTTVRGTYDSNVYARRSATDDFYFSLIPELQYLRRAGRGEIDARAGVDITRFVDLSRENHEDFFGSLYVTLPTHRDSPLSGDVRLAYIERTGINEFLNRRLKTENYRVNTSLLYRTSDRLALRNSLGYRYQRAQDSSNIEAIHGTFGFQHEYSENLSLFTDYRLRRTTSSGEAGRPRVENIDHAVFIGGIGELRPRLTGTASVGYQHTSARGARSEDTNLVVAATELEWEMRPRTDLTLNVSRDMDVSPNDFSAEVLNTTLGIRHRIEPKTHLTGYAGYSRFRFRGGETRRDEAVHFGAGSRYIFSAYWDAGLDYQFTTNDSTEHVANYDRHIVHASTRYSF